ncbi:hypothetical protein JCM8547_002537 [Rhodosporidiobolus lusitaniae]
MISRLPPKLLREVLLASLPPPSCVSAYPERQSSLRADCLVSKTWFDLAQPLLNQVLQPRREIGDELFAALPRLQPHLRLRHLTLTQYRFMDAFPLPSYVPWRRVKRGDPIELTSLALPRLKALYLSGDPLPPSEGLKDQLDMVQFDLEDPEGYPSWLSDASFLVLLTLKQVNGFDTPAIPPGVPTSYLQPVYPVPFVPHALEGVDVPKPKKRRGRGGMVVTPALPKFHCIMLTLDELKSVCLPAQFRLSRDLDFHPRLVEERDDVLKECKARGTDIIWRLGFHKPEDDLEVRSEFWQYAREEKRKAEVSVW